ncbi:MAG TPA: T9SS type A sorting domain-containing protein [Candidatus Eisenbacteria bacterium]|nr:T9SS type A sorting domain-containing protein [Candidatus Eisenbacteria bacterium]
MRRCVPPFLCLLASLSIATPTLGASHDPWFLDGRAVPGGRPGGATPVPSWLAVDRSTEATRFAGGATEAPRAGDALWSGQFSFPVTDGQIVAMTRYRGDLIVGGSFAHIGGIAASGIARWDGATWAALGAGVDGAVRALAVLGDSLIVGGTFRRAGNAPASGVAAWNGTTWTSLPFPVPELSYYSTYVLAMRVHEDALYVGGQFFFADHPGWRGVLRWDGAQWDSLGAGVGGSVYSISAHAGSLFAGGNFTEAGGVAASAVAEWTGAEWRPLADGLSNPPYQNALVTALASFDGRLYAGGYFALAGNVSTSGLAAWNGSAWDTIAVAPLDPVFALESFGGSLAIATWNGIRIWSGSTEGPAIQGFEGTIMALHAEGNDLFAGGDFAIASPGGGAPKAYRVARWDGEDWHGFEAWSDEMNGIVTRYGTPSSDATLASYKHWVLASGYELYTGGAAGPRALGSLATWNGSKWESFAPPLPGYAYPRTLAVEGQKLWLAGYFNGIEPSPYETYRVVEFDGATWSGLDSLMESPTALVSVEGTLYAALPGGYPGGPKPQIVRRTAGRWEAIGDVGTPYYSYGATRLTSYRGRLIAVGEFTSIGGVAAAGVAEWDGTVWRALGYGLGACGDPRAWVAESFGGRLLVSARCPYPPFNGAAIAAWDGREWRPVPGILGRVTGMKATTGALVVVGEFQLTGANETTFAATWDGLEWSPIDLGVSPLRYSGPPISIAATQDAFYFAGPFYEAGGKPSVGIAKWNGLRPLTITPRAWLSAGRPNPFRAATDFTFHLEQQASVRVAVYDVRGREVVMLDESFRVPGDHPARWDGRDRYGRPAPAGIYFVSVRTRDGEVASQKIVRLR